MTHYTPQSRLDKFLYWLCSSLWRIVFKFLCGIEVSGAENVPRTGGLLVASNHISNADPPFVAVTIPRTIYFFAKEELFRIPFFGWLISHLNAFPVKR